MYGKPREAKRKNAVKISRARRVESQRSTQTSTMRVKKMLASAKAASTSVDQGAGEGWAMLRTTSIQRAKMAQVRMGSIAMRPEDTRKYPPAPAPMMGPKATTPRMGKRMMRA